MMNGVTRHAQFAGTWYPRTLEEAESYWTPAPTRERAIAAISPHSGWMYSGRVAGEVYSALEPADVYVVLGPNHTGRGQSDTSLYPAGTWKLPQNDIEIDAEFAADLMHLSEFLSEDPESHVNEHCIEVQVPFLLLLNPRAKLVPILMRDHDPEIFHDLGRALAAARKKHAARRVLLIATTDMTHYEPKSSAAPKDRGAIERMMALDPDGLKQLVDNLGISMCGLGPVGAVLGAARALGGSQGRLVRYATSGDVTQDDESVVGYAGLTIH